MFGREDPAVVRTLAAQRSLIESDAAVRSAQRRYEANPHDTDARDHYYRTLDRAGKSDEADRLHFASLAHHGQHLADAHRRWVREDSPSTRAQWHRHATDSLDHAMDLVRDRHPDWGHAHHRSGQDHSEALHQIARHIPREGFPEGEQGDYEHRLAIMAIHKFTSPALGARTQRTSRPPYHERNEWDPHMPHQPETYTGLGAEHFGHDAVRSLHHHGYGKHYDMSVSPASSTSTTIRLTRKRNTRT